ncbi:MAG: NAD(P)-binding domain-containing protein [Bacteroidales bacterium]|jgi:thioredoxin reductase|nr:NAD(P)-binding domain-containing protein [Bacteroidales bacterium]
MDPLLEKIIIYGLVFALFVLVTGIYLWRKRRESRSVESKIALAHEMGLHEPVSLHPYVDPARCIETGACIAACPEKDILGIRNGKATIINASRCIGHGACFHACPTEAISLRIGTEKRGVELPHVDRDFQTNVPGIYIAGELGGMGLIKNAVEQGRQAVDNIAKTIRKDHGAQYDLVIVGAGPAGISGALNARKHGLKFLLLEQDTLGGTVYTFPRKKIIMTSPMELPLYGKIKLYETTKSELLNLWENLFLKFNIDITENSKVESIEREDGLLKVSTGRGNKFITAAVLLAIGRRGTPRKLNVPGEVNVKVAYRLMEPEQISDQNILVVGGGDSAVEAALLLSEKNKVTLSYRGDAFGRIKQGNSSALADSLQAGRLEVRLKSNVVSIEDETITLSEEGDRIIKMKNDLVYIFAGGELPIQFLDKAGIKITKKFGETVMKH